MCRFYTSRIFLNIASEDDTFFFWIIFVKFHSKNFIWLRKMWRLFLHPNNRRVLPISTANNWKIFMSNFRINWVKKNDVKLSWKFCNFTRPKFCGIFAFLVLASATAKTSVYWISSRYFFIFNYFSPPYLIRCLKFLSYELIYNQ